MFSLASFSGFVRLLSLQTPDCGCCSSLLSATHAHYDRLEETSNISVCMCRFSMQVCIFVFGEYKYTLISLSNSIQIWRNTQGVGEDVDKSSVLKDAGLFKWYWNADNCFSAQGRKFTLQDVKYTKKLAQHIWAKETSCCSRTANIFDHMCCNRFYVLLRPFTLERLSVLSVLKSV